MNKNFLLKEDIQMACRYIKICYASLIIRKMQIKMPIRPYLIPVRLAHITENKHNQGWYRCGGNRPALTAGGNID